MVVTMPRAWTVAQNVRVTQTVPVGVMIAHWVKEDAMAEQFTPSCADCLKAQQPIRIEHKGQYLVCMRTLTRVPLDGEVCAHYSSATGLMNHMDRCINLATKLLEGTD